jgi:hypothetical protein
MDPIGDSVLALGISLMMGFPTYHSPPEPTAGPDENRAEV